MTTLFKPGFLLGLIAAIGLFALAGATGAANAQVLDMTKVAVLPHFDMPADEFISQTDIFKDTPFGNKYLAYKVRLPKGWIKKEANISNTMDLSKKLLGEIGGYYGPAHSGGRSTFEIQASELDYEITAQNWFMNYIFSHGYTLQGLNKISDKRIEALFVVLERDQSSVVRAVVEVNGSRVVLAKYAVPEAQWNTERAFQSTVLKSFQFTSPEPVRVEEKRTYAFLDLVRFDYPKSWRLLAPNIFSIEAMDAKIVNAQEDSTLNGEVDIHIVSTEVDTTLSEEIKNVQKSLETKGLLIGTLIEQPQEINVREHIYFSRIEVYQANDKDKELVDYEYWIGVLMEDRYFYIVTMLTPARNTDFSVWARNAEAFKTVVESLRP